MSRLAGHTVAVTRARHQARELVEALEAEGARVIELPALTVGPSDEPDRLRALLRQVSSFDLVVVTSQNTVEIVLNTAREVGGELGHARFAAVGEKTAAALRAGGVEPSVVPAVYRAEALVAAIRGALLDLSGRRILLPRADEGREVLVDALTAAGAEVEVVSAYRLVRADPPAEEALRGLEAATAVTFLSGKTLEFFLDVVGEARARAFLERVVVAVIGPVAQEAAAGLGVRVDVVPKVATVASLVDALANQLASGLPRG